MNIGEALKKAIKELRTSDSQSPQLDAEILLAHVINKTREYILSHTDEDLDNPLLEKYHALTDRRKNNEPVAHLTGHKEFYGLDFVINKHTLIPRPETELMVEHAVQSVTTLGEKDILITDIGTGSGCIAISTASLLREKGLLSSIDIIACDISSSALTICKKNIQKHSLNDSISTLEGNLLKPVMNNNLFENKKVLIVLSNLPYLSSEIYDSCPKTVRDFEPKNALLSPAKGLSHYEELLEQLTEVKTMFPLLKIISFFEISPEQNESIKKVIKNKFPNSEIEIFKDQSSKWRLVKTTI